MTKPHRVVRLIQHEESFEVRVSHFVYFDDDAGRRAVSGRLTREAALDQAQQLARDEDGK